MKKWDDERDNPTLISLNAAGWNDGRIAELMGIGIKVINARRNQLGIGPAKQARDTSPKDEPNPIFAAAMLLGTRMTERDGGYWLDGRPIRLTPLMQTANEVRLAQGMPQLGPLHWRVPES